jgi:hypothetical protein
MIDSTIAPMSGASPALATGLATRAGVEVVAIFLGRFHRT